MRNTITQENKKGTNAYTSTQINTNRTYNNKTIKQMKKKITHKQTQK